MLNLAKLISRDEHTSLLCQTISFFAFSFVGRAVRTVQLSQYLSIKLGTNTIEELRKPYNQGTLIEGEGTVQLTSSLR